MSGCESLASRLGDHVGLSAGCGVLSVGCGRGGGELHFFKEKYGLAHITGVDKSRLSCGGEHSVRNVRLLGGDANGIKERFQGKTR